MTEPRFDAAVFAALGVQPRAASLDSRTVAPGDVFLAFPGARGDGRAHIAQAVAQGAAVVLWEAGGFEWDPAWRVPNAAVPGLRRLAGEVAAHVYGHPSRELHVAGITGTNGKTSCSHWIAQAMTACGRRTAVLGTLGNGFPGDLAPATHTTPDPVSLQRELRRLRGLGAEAVAMEVSSHALQQDRVVGVRFETALFTNLTRDHLDYHGDMAAYGAAKARLFDWTDLANAVINADDRFGRELVGRASRAGARVLSYGLGHGDIAGHDLRLSLQGLELRVSTPWGATVLRSRLIGGFNASNLLGALGVLLAAGLPLQEAVGALEQARPVAGRLDLLQRPGAPLVVVDYAHTPDALEKVLETLHELVGHEAGARLLCVFGCGGGRDVGKRPLMGAIATRLADLAIITSDNPRDEDPAAIVSQVVAGAAPNHEACLDRAEAIARALHLARPGDVVLIAGKGHETTQEIRGEKRAFDDLAVARSVLDGGAGV
jgi:UDP-N-acetylmuramoyl-L-alanyl-D-glutamate--2,6-diaminopimelate ligase